MRFESSSAWPEGIVGAAVRDLHALVFSYPEVSESELKSRLELQANPLVLLAWHGPQLVAYKIGYERKKGHYYSWIGGVHPDFRCQGLAAELMIRQHDWCREQGYKTIRTHTKNKWRQMLILNIRHEFDIIGTLTDEYGEPKLILEKKFSQPAH
jgi:predicted GNAT superfamily acetyltransferase